MGNRLTVGFLALTLLLFVSGCSGGSIAPAPGASTSPTSAPPRNGSASASIAFVYPAPADARRRADGARYAKYLGAGLLSADVTFLNGATPVAAQSFDLSGCPGNVCTVTGVPLGTWSLQVITYDSPVAAGSARKPLAAHTTASVTIVAGPNNVAITLDAVVKSVSAAQPAYDAMQSYQNVPLTLTYSDANAVTIPASTSLANAVMLTLAPTTGGFCTAATCASAPVPTMTLTSAIPTIYASTSATAGATVTGTFSPAAFVSSGTFAPSPTSFTVKSLARFHLYAVDSSNLTSSWGFGVPAGTPTLPTTAMQVVSTQGLTTTAMYPYAAAASGGHLYVPATSSAVRDYTLSASGTLSASVDINTGVNTAEGVECDAFCGVLLFDGVSMYYAGSLTPGTLSLLYSSGINPPPQIGGTLAAPSGGHLVTLNTVSPYNLVQTSASGSLQASTTLNRINYQGALSSAGGKIAEGTFNNTSNLYELDIYAAPLASGAAPSTSTFGHAGNDIGGQAAVSLVDAVHNRVYVGCADCSTLGDIVYDTSGTYPVKGATIPLGGSQPTAMAADSTDTLLFTATGGKTVYLYDTVTGQQFGSILAATFSGTPSGLAVGP